MKSLKRLSATLSLALILSLSAAAGDMHGGIVDPPPPPPDEQQQVLEPSAASSTPMESVTGVDPVTEVVLNLLQSVLSLF